ncbi:phosphopantetheine-binding protein [Kribbella qitaiheensis]|nr:phosphopantetheine-binding protein [Kribbella qitaiheensis]
MAPETDTERVLVAIWSEVLGAERVGTTDGYFELGGDSVQSLLISSQATALFDVAVSPREVMTARTVAGLAELVENKILSEVELAEFDDRSNDDRSRRPR